MSSFVLNRNYALQLPNSFVEVDREEMEYVDGGWSGTVFKNNMVGICNKYAPSGAFRYAGGAAAISTSWTYWTTVSKVGAAVGETVAAAAAVVSGPVGVALGAVAILGAAGATWYLGNNRKFY